MLRRAIRDGTTPTMARWLADGGYALLEWETDLSSQTGASQAGILLGSNENIPAFRWVEKESGQADRLLGPGRLRRDRAPAHERHRAARDGGTSRGNLLSGEADEALLTVSRLAEEREPNPGYRAFLANGANVTRTVVLFTWEVVLELIAAARQRRRDVQPRGHRGGIYPLLRAGMCVFVRDLVTFSVLQDMFRGVPAVYATFASYDEVAHHSGLERPDTLEALRKLDQRFAMLERARRYAPRPYEIVVLSDHGQTQGATFRQRNGYGLDELVERSLASGKVDAVAARRRARRAAAPGASTRRRGRTQQAQGEERRVGRDVVVLGLGQPRPRLPDGGAAPADARGDRGASPAAARRAARAPARRLRARALGARRRRRARRGRHAPARRRARRGRGPARARSAPNAARHLLRTDGFAHVADIMVNSFYDPVTEEGCAFEELISFHGGLGGPQTRPFILHPAHLPRAGRAARRRRRGQRAAAVVAVGGHGGRRRGTGPGGRGP